MRLWPLTGRQTQHPGQTWRAALCLAVLLGLPQVPSAAGGAQTGAAGGANQPADNAAALPGADVTYRVIFKKKKAQAESALQDTSDVDALRKQLQEASTPPSGSASAPEPAPAAEALSSADRERARAMLDVVEQSRQIARDKLKQAEHAANPAEAMVLAREASDAVEQANRLAHSLLPANGAGSPVAAPPEGAVAPPPSFDCGKWFSCRQAMLIQENKMGFDGREIPDPNAGDAAVDLRVGNTNFFGAQQRAAGPPPGGIRFSGVRADGLALMLDVTAIDFDPVHNRLALIGSRSQHPFDLDVFADVLRLAVEQYEPFFSLESDSARAWDYETSDAARLLAEREGSPPEVAARIRAVNPHALHRGTTDYYFATLDAVDPEVDREVRETHDVAVKLVFSPSWLRYSKVGWILYRADLAIKGIASGFVVRGRGVVPSPAWEMEDFDPIWLHNQGPGRADFELDDTPAAVTSTGVDLSAVRPTLYVTGRKAGTQQDIAPSKRDRAISEHFSRHWQEYTHQLPELRELEEVYRAYVAAYYLVRHHPGLAERILSMPAVRAPQLPPLYVYLPMVLFTATRDGAPVSLDPARRFDYDIGGGYGGGTIFRIHKVRYDAAPAGASESISWFHSASRAAGLYSAWIEQAGNAAAVLQVEGNKPPRGWMAISAALLAALAAFAAWLSVGLRLHPWQHLREAAVCAHCARMHRRLGLAGLMADTLAAAALLYLLAASFLLAAHAGQLQSDIQAAGPDSLLPMALLTAGWAMGIPLVGATVHRLLMWRRPVAALSWLAEFLLGARVLMLLAGALLASMALQGRSAASVVFLLAGHALGERLLSAAGGPLAIVPVLTAGALLAFAAALLNWAVPFATGSRPLPWQNVPTHSHSAS